MASFSHRARFRWDHRWTTAHMSAYLDGELRSVGGRARAERHLAECESCRRLLERLREVLGVLQRMPARAAGSDPRQTAATVRRRLHEPPAG